MAANTAPAIQPATTPAHRALQLVELSTAAMEKAAEFQAQVSQVKAASVALIPAVCDALIAGNFVRADQRTKLAAALENPPQALELLQKLAERQVALASDSSLGQGRAGIGVKAANATGERPFVGAAVKKQASASLFRNLGLPVPADV